MLGWCSVKYGFKINYLDMVIIVVLKKMNSGGVVDVIVFLWLILFKCN